MNSNSILSLRLNSGITITANEVTIGKTYRGRGYGHPTKGQHELFLAAIRQHYEAPQYAPAAYIVPSDAQEKATATTDDDGEVLPLPPIQLSAQFTGPDKDEDPEEPVFTAALTLIWHQADPTPFMSPEVEAKAAQLDWHAHASPRGLSWIDPSE